MSIFYKTNFFWSSEKKTRNYHTLKILTFYRYEIDFLNKLFTRNLLKHIQQIHFRHYFRIVFLSAII